MQLTVRHLLPQELPEIRSWYEDAELARRLTYPTDEWYTAVSREGQESWVAVDETNTIVAKMQVDRDGDIGYIDLAVRPELRRRGFGSAALMAFIAGPGKAYSMLEGRIEPDNIASLACVRRCGFRLLDEFDDDGLIPARWNNPDSV